MRRWMKYIKPYKTWFILGPLCMLVEVVGEVLMPMMLAGVINAGNAGTLTETETGWTLTMPAGNVKISV